MTRVPATLALPVAAAANGDDVAPCGADAFDGLIGQPVSDVDATWPDKTRIPCPGQVATADYLPERRNADMDPEHRIVARRCGQGASTAAPVA